MSFPAILDALRLAAATIDPITAKLISQRRDDASAGATSSLTVDALLADAGVDVAAESDALAISTIAEELEHFLNPARPRIYLCHPYSAADKSDPERARAEEARNIQNTLAWLRWFVNHTTWAVGAPWIPYVMALNERAYRARGIADDLAMISVHNGLVCVTPTLTAGMADERDHARRCDLPVLDLTVVPGMTFEPPEPGSDLSVLLRQLIENFMPGTVRPVDYMGQPIAQGARPRVDGCDSNECTIRNTCIRSGGCGQDPI